jgi:hypothetical protein
MPIVVSSFIVARLYGRSSLAALLLIFVLSSVVTVPLLVYRFFKEGEHGLLRSRWKITTVRLNISNALAVLSVILSVLQHSALCFLSDSVWNNDMVSRAVRDVFRAIVGLVFGSARTPLLVACFIFFAMIQTYLGVSLYEIVMRRKGQALASDSGIFISMLSGPCYNLTMQVLLNRLVGLEGHGAFASLVSFVVFGYSLSALLLNIVGAGKPPVSRDIALTAALQVFPAITDLVLTAVSTLSRVGEVSVSASNASILSINIFWGLVILVARPSTVRGVNLFMGTARVLVAWAAATTMVPLRGPMPPITLFAGWIFITLIALGVWRVGRPSRSAENAEKYVPNAVPPEEAVAAIKVQVDTEMAKLSKEAHTAEYHVRRGRALMNAPAPVGEFPQARRGRLEIALAEFRDASQIEPESPEIWDLTATALFRLERFPEAREAAEIAVSLHSTSTRANFLGIIYIKCALYAEASEAARRAASARDKNCPYALATVALAEAHLGRFDLAKRFLDKAESFPGLAGVFGQERQAIIKMQETVLSL